MVRSAATIPHVTNFDDADVTDLERIRQGVPPGTLGPDVKLTLLPFVMKAVAACLRRAPGPQRQPRRARNSRSSTRNT